MNPNPPLSSFSCWWVGLVGGEVMASAGLFGVQTNTNQPVGWQTKNNGLGMERQIRQNYLRRVERGANQPDPRLW